ncbi:unnamed protein product, partial [Discosporangium mesarthrocarpum]
MPSCSAKERTVAVLQRNLSDARSPFTCLFDLLPWRLGVSTPASFCSVYLRQTVAIDLGLELNMSPTRFKSPLICWPFADPLEKFTNDGMTAILRQFLAFRCVRTLSPSDMVYLSVVKVVEEELLLELRLPSLGVLVPGGHLSKFQTVTLKLINFLTLIKALISRKNYCVTKQTFSAIDH